MPLENQVEILLARIAVDVISRAFNLDWHGDWFLGIHGSIKNMHSGRLMVMTTGPVTFPQRHFVPAGRAIGCPDEFRKFLPKMIVKNQDRL